MSHFLPTLVPLAAALLLSLAFGRLASRVGVPRVTVYLLVGLALGPSVAMRFVSEDGLAQAFLLGSGTETALNVVEQLGIGFILFGIGAEFRFQKIREVGARVLGLSGAEIGTTALFVGGCVFLATGDWRLGVIAPALAISSAPSATLVTLRELEAEGPTSRSLILCVGYNNIVALLAFPLLLSVAFGVGQPLQASGRALTALAVGGAAGFGAAVWLESIRGRRELVLLGILLVLALIGVAHGIQPGATGLGMLACFAAGVALSNGSPHAEELFRYLENTVYPIYVLFFVAAGRDLHLDAILQGGALGVLFIFARASGKLFGAGLGLRLTGMTDSLPNTFGAGLMCHAGIALGLVVTLENVAPEATEGLRHVVVASVVVFELIGPWLVRRTVVATGEVTLASLLPHADATGIDAFRWVMLELRRNLGLLRAHDGTDTPGARVEHAMRRRPRTVSASLPFEEVLTALAETGADLLPVVDEEGRFKGAISYDEVKTALYDPVLRDLVIAEDLTSEIEDPLEADSTLGAALAVMDRNRVQSWPVVKEGRLLGIVRRMDLYALMRRS